MKPCKACPFRPDAPHGLWAAAHYLAIAYLGSVTDPIPELLGQSMGCHEWNGRLSPNRQPEDTPRCGGWVRAARDSLNVRLAMAFSGLDPEEVYDDTPVLSPRDMAEANGLDVGLLPDLHYDPGSGQTYDEWKDGIVALRQAVLDDPTVALDYVVPGSPLALGVERDDVVRAFGEAAASTYFGG